MAKIDLIMLERVEEKGVKEVVGRVRSFRAWK
jgi:hypothetical protein